MSNESNRGQNSRSSPYPTAPTPGSAQSGHYEEGEPENKNIEEDIAMDLEEMEILETPNEDGQSGRSKRKLVEKRARAWDHFTPFEDNDGKRRAKCNYCDKHYAAHSSKNGTSGMNSHMKTCKNHPDNVKVSEEDKNQTKISFNRGGEIRSTVWKYDYDAIRKALIRMLIKDELHFKFVENEGFLDFMSFVCPQFNVPSRRTINVPSRRTIARYYFCLFTEENNKLKNYFKTSGQRVSLTTDTWTSNQRLTYLVLTRHYIDDSWKMCKVILNFIPYPSHKRDEVGLLIEKCLLDWGLDKVFTVTIDNASSNDTTVAYLRRRLVNWGTAILGGTYLHMRCVAHIINLVVKDGLKELNISIERVRTVVRYVRQSPSRLRKFNEFVIEEKVKSKRSLCLDVPTRWNSVYTMLETAVVFKNVFDRYEVSDTDFRADFGISGPYANIGLPTKEDWVVAERFVKVLRYFFDLTVRVSGSFFVTSNTFVDEISDVDELLRGWLGSTDTVLVYMSKQMKLKFDKYWGNIEKMNMFLYVADILDSRHKMNYLQYVLKNMYGAEQAQLMTTLIKSSMFELFDEYKKMYAYLSGASVTSSSSETTDSTSDSGNDEEDERARIRLNKKRYMQSLSDDGVGAQSELDLYLQEPITKDLPGFDILDWWRTNSYRFPILSRLVRDVLGMPISTVASESAFSTGGRVIDEFRASLTPKMAQALICCQDWLRHTPLSSMAEDEEFLKKLEKELVINSGSDSNILGL